MNQAIEVFDLQRMLFGDTAPLFLLEIVVRTTIVYAYALALLRWLGSRTIGQLSTVEFLLVIALGSAVGDAMFYPEVPLLHALLVVTIVVLANKGLDMLIARSKTAERVIDGAPEEVITDGVICTGFLTRAPLGTSELFQQLRHRGVEHLGQVERAYIEADGVVTVFRGKTDRHPGLPIVPPWEIELPPVLEGDAVATVGGVFACTQCGFMADIAAGAKPGACMHCGHQHWTEARSEPEYREK